VDIKYAELVHLLFIKDLHGVDRVTNVFFTLELPGLDKPTT